MLEDKPKVLSGCGEDGVDLIAGCAEKVVSAKPANVFGMAGHWLDRGTPFQFAVGRRDADFAAVPVPFVRLALLMQTTWDAGNAYSLLLPLGFWASKRSIRL